MKIAILGAGLMGRTLSFRLYQEGYNNLTLFDQDDINGKISSAYVAAGMLSPYFESVMGGINIYNLGKKSLTLWQQYLSLLDLKHLYNDYGTILLATHGFSNDMDHYIKKISANVDKTDYYYKLDQFELIKIEQQLKFNYAYFIPDEACINARQVLKGLGDYLYNKIKWQHNIKVSYSSSTQNILVNDQLKGFDFVIDCRGLGSRDLQPNLRGVRGEIIRVYASEVALKHPIRLFYPRQNIYITPYSKHDYIIGATEIEAEDFSPISIKSALELLNLACVVHPGFNEARILEMNTNCRPTLNNNLPQIKAYDNFISINGLYRHGFLIAPTLAETIINYLNTGIKQYPEIWSE